MDAVTTSTTTSTTTTDGLALTEAAAAKVKELISREATDQLLALRVAVQPGGCSGLRYSLYFDDEIKDTDVKTDFDGVSLVIDKMSAPYLKGASVDYVDTLQQSGFTINNPNAQSSCACGDSFN